MPMVPFWVLRDKGLPGLCQSHHPDQVHFSLHLKERCSSEPTGTGLTSQGPAHLRAESGPHTWPFCLISGFTLFLGTNPLFTKMVILEEKSQPSKSFQVGKGF